MLRITRNIAIRDSEIQVGFTRSSGPGGQNVNKVSTAVQLRFDAAGCPSLPEHVRGRLIRLAGRRITADGILIIEARRFRTQEANRRDALKRLAELIQKAAIVPKSRYKTRPTRASKKRRLETKHRRADTKRMRRPIGRLEE